MQKADLGARVAGEMSASLKEIVDSINESNRLIMEIAKASEVQSLSISQINISIAQAAEIIQRNSALAEENAAASEDSAAASEQSAAAADDLSSQVTILKELISQFKLKE
jgi:methyl-accepting chemotaxis protein